MKKIAYVRVSTPEQRHDRQIAGLMGLCDELHIETLSACSTRRPVYDRVLRRLKAGDMLVVWDLDRAFRSVVDALTEAEKLRQRGVHFQIANLGIDTTTPAGIFVYTMLSALVEFERRMLSQRTKEGLEAARARGIRIGRPPLLTAEQLRDAQARIPASGQEEEDALALGKFDGDQIELENAAGLAVLAGPDSADFTGLAAGAGRQQAGGGLFRRWHASLH